MATTGGYVSFAHFLLYFILRKEPQFKLYYVENTKTSRLNSVHVDLDETAHYEPSHLNLQCLQI